MKQRRWVWVCLGVVLMGCGGVPDKPTRLGADSPPYVKEVFADDPVGHWRLDGSLDGAIADDRDGATAPRQPLALKGGELGGPEVAVEVWVRDAQGTIVSYQAQGGGLAVAASPTLRVTLFDEELDTGVALAEGAWQLVGVSWRASDGLALVAVDGREVWRGVVGRGAWLPFGGRLQVGALQRGGVDEVAAFDRFRYPGEWLDRLHVARGVYGPSPMGAALPVQSRTQLREREVLTDVAWSPDGALVAYGGGDFKAGTVKVWDPTTGATVLSVMTPSRVTRVAWSPDGRWIAAVVDEEGRVELIGVAGDGRHTLTTRGGGVQLAWSPDGARLAGAGEGGVVWVWDPRDGEAVATFQAHTREGTPTGVTWSPDGTRLVVAHAVWDAATGARRVALKSEPDPDDSEVAFAWSPDGARIASNEAVWDAASGARLLELKDGGCCGAVAWSPDGSKLANFLYVWDAATGEKVFEPSDDREGPSFGERYLAAWSPDGARVATGGWGGLGREVVIADAATGARVGVASLDGTPIQAFRWSPDGARLAIVSSKVQRGEPGSLGVWDAAANDLILDPRRIASPVRAVAWSPDGASLAVGSEGGGAVWDMRSGALRRVLSDEAVTAAAWSPDGAKLALGGEEGQRRAVTVWDAATGARLLTHGQRYRDDSDFDPVLGAVAWSPDGARIASSVLDVAGGHVAVWDAATGEHARRLNLAEGAGALSLAWSPDGAMLAAGGDHWVYDAQTRRDVSNDGLVAVWDAASGKTLHTLREERALVRSVAWSGAGRLVLGGGDLSTGRLQALLRAIAPRGGQTLQAFSGASEGGDTALNMAQAVAVSPDGARIVAAGWGVGALGEVQGAARVYSASGELLHTLTGLHRPWINAAAWSPDGSRIALGGDDGAVTLWTPESGDRVTLYLDHHGGDWLVLTQDGYFAGSPDAPVALTQGLRAYPVAQLAPARNRPDKVLAALGGPADAIAFYEALWRRRLTKLGLRPEQVSASFAEAPTAHLAAGARPDLEGVLEVQALLRDRQGLQSYTVYVNGVPTTAAPVRVTGTRQRVQLAVQLTRGENLVEVSALNARGVESLRASTTVEHDGEGLPEPRLFFLGFGVSDYADDDLDLAYAHQDALDLEEALSQGADGDDYLERESPDGSRFAEVITRTFTDAEVTPGAIDAAREFLAEVTEHDTLILFIAGHGARDVDDARTYYYLGHGADPANLAATAIPFEAIEALLYTSRARKKLFLLDTCQSGEQIDLALGAAGEEGLAARSVRGFRVGGAKRAEPSEATRRMWLAALRDRDRMILMDLSRRSGAIVLASSLGQESSFETPAWSNGAFTEELLKALQSDEADDNGDGFVATDELVRWVTAQVPELTEGRQHPNVERDNPLQAFALPLPSSDDGEMDHDEYMRMLAEEYGEGDGLTGFDARDSEDDEDLDGIDVKEMGVDGALGTRILGEGELKDVMGGGDSGGGGFGRVHGMGKVDTGGGRPGLGAKKEPGLKPIVAWERVQPRGCGRGEVLTVLEGSEGALRYCYEKELQRDPELAGEVTFQVKIGAEGQVTDVSVAKATLHERAHGCMLRVLKRKRFPAKACAVSATMTFRADTPE